MHFDRPRRSEAQKREADQEQRHAHRTGQGDGRHSRVPALVRRLKIVESSHPAILQRLRPNATDQSGAAARKTSGGSVSEQSGGNVAGETAYTVAWSIAEPRPGIRLPLPHRTMLRTPV